MPLEVAGKLLWRHKGGRFRTGDVGEGGRPARSWAAFPAWMSHASRSPNGAGQQRTAQQVWAGRAGLTHSQGPPHVLDRRRAEVERAGNCLTGASERCSVGSDQILLWLCPRPLQRLHVPTSTQSRAAVGPSHRGGSRQAQRLYSTHPRTHAHGF